MDVNSVFLLTTFGVEATGSQLANSLIPDISLTKESLGMMISIFPATEVVHALLKDTDVP